MNRFAQGGIILAAILLIAAGYGLWRVWTWMTGGGW